MNQLAKSNSHSLVQPSYDPKDPTQGIVSKMGLADGQP